MLRHVAEFPSFLRLNNIPLCVYIAFCLCIHLSRDNWLISPFWLLCIMLLKHGRPNIGVPTCSSFGDILRRGITGSDGHSTWNFFEEPPPCLLQSYAILHSHQQSQGFQFLYNLAIPVIFFFYSF